MKIKKSRMKETMKIYLIWKMHQSQERENIIREER